MAESFTCLVGIITYLVMGTDINWSIAPPLLVGAVASVPLSALLVKRINTEKFTFVIGVVTTLLGCLTLCKAFL